MHIGLYGDPPTWTTGYSLQLQALAQTLADHGHTVEWVSLHPTGPHPTWRIWPTIGWRGVLEASPRWDGLISLTDDYRLLGFGDEVPAPLNPPACPWVRWVAYDGGPLPWAYLPLLAMSATVPVSPFGARVIRQALPDWDGVVIPHGVDVAFFRPPSEEEHRMAQALLCGGERPFVLGFVSRAITRKQLTVWLATFAALRKQVPDLHGVVRAALVDEGVDYWEVVDRFDLWGSLTWVDSPSYVQGVDPEQLRQVYWACDALWHPAVSEGFGLTLAEARACGRPVLCTRFSAMADWALPEEGIAPAGIQWIGPFQTEQAIVDWEAAVRRLREWIRHPERVSQLGMKARDRIVSGCRLEVMQQTWGDHWERLWQEAATRQILPAVAWMEVA